MNIREQLLKAGIISRDEERKDLWEDALLPLALIHFDPSYQRDLNQGHIKKIVEDYDPILMEPPLINWREDGSFYGMDGQHRIHALLEVFGDGAQHTCRLFYGLSPEQEAKIFGAQDFRRKLTPVDRFRGGLKAGREPYVSISAIAAATGWDIALYYGDKHETKGIQAVGSLLEVYRVYRSGHLTATLNMLRECFGTDITPTAPLITGMAQFLSWYEGDYDEKYLIRCMRAVGLSGMRIEVETRRLLDRVSGREAVGMAIVMFYNKKRPRAKRLLAWQDVVPSRPGGGKSGSRWADLDDGDNVNPRAHPRSESDENDDRGTLVDSYTSPL